MPMISEFSNNKLPGINGEYDWGSVAADYDQYILSLFSPDVLNIACSVITRELQKKLNWLACYQKKKFEMGLSLLKYYS
ncbi:MAG: hypothetical protein R8G33_02410 [Gammaproteobacteria bacterium]|nr:hypothetical protein [Gammaproteobacteria bacterium]